jgi:hypothetical protein
MRGYLRKSIFVYFSFPIPKVRDAKQRKLLDVLLITDLNFLNKNQNHMKNKNYHRTITVNASPGEAMKKISEVHLWWKKDFSGRAEKLNNKFTVPFDKEGIAFVNFRVSELQPEEKVVWKVTDCYLPWFNDKKEWNNTEVTFEISSVNDQTQIDFIHIGLVPGIECYEVCEKGWDGHVTNSLVKFMNEGVGLPQ